MDTRSQIDEVAHVLEIIERHAQNGHSLSNDALAAHTSMSADTFGRVFRELVGLTPKQYARQVHLCRALKRIDQSSDLLGFSESMGFSSSSRLHDLFVDLIAMTPGEYRSGGEGLSVRHGVAQTRFGQAGIIWSERGIMSIEFIGHDAVHHDLDAWRRQWPQAEFIRDDRAANTILESAFSTPDKPLRLWVHGTNFQINVWRALLRIPMGHTTTYSVIAQAIGAPRAQRAVGSAIGSNVIAYLIPCHRVLRSDAGLGGYKWGVAKKRALLTIEARVQPSMSPDC